MGLGPLYEPIELLRDDGIRTYSAREIATGKVVLFHLFAGAQPQTTQELLAQIQTLKDRRIPELIEAGMNEGVPFVVTEYTPRVVSLREWVLTQMDRYGVPLPAGSLDHLTRVGRWKVPVAPAPIPPQQTGPDEFTRMFQAGAPPKPIGEPVPPAPVAAPVPPPVAPPAPASPSQPQTGPGEFTRMFQAGAPPKPIGEPVPPPSAPASSSQPQTGPGEFTRMFQAGAPSKPIGEPAPTPVEPPGPASSPQPQTGPGEFTRMFQAGAPPKPIDEPAAPLISTPAAAQAPAFLPQPQAGPGEFTRYFSSPLPSSNPAFGLAATPQFQPPPVPVPSVAAAPPPTPFASPGEFTRIFGKSELGVSPPATPILPALPVAPGMNPAVPPSGTATPNFPPAPQFGPKFSPPAATPMPQTSGAPGEYTRMFGPQPASAPAPTPFPDSAPLGSPLRASGPAGKKSVLPLILILAGLFLAAILVVVIFAIRK